jgi:hypothetical protein
MEGSNSGDGRGDTRLCGVPESGHGERSIKVLSDLGDYPISDGPSVNPIDISGRVKSFYEYGRPESSNGLWDEIEKVVVGIVSSGEKAHQKLLRRRTMEPPLEVWS